MLKELAHSVKQLKVISQKRISVENFSSIVLSKSGITKIGSEKLNKIDECKKFLHSRDFIDNYIVCDDFNTTLTILNEVNGITIMPLSLINSSKQLNLIEEKITNDFIGWSEVNRYWVDDDNFVWKSEQYISPKLPGFYIEVTKKLVQ